MRDLISCSECGYQNEPGERFCTRCGRPLRQAAGENTGGGETVPTRAPGGPRKRGPILALAMSLLIIIAVAALIVIIARSGSPGEEASDSVGREDTSGKADEPPAPPIFTGERWRFLTGGEVESSPAVWEGTVFCGSEDGFIYALDAAAGTERWRFRTGDEVSSSPAVSDGTAYCGSDDRSIHALE